MKLKDLMEMNQEQREIEYMRVLGLEEVDPISILDGVLQKIILSHKATRERILLEFAKALKLACTRVEAPEGDRGELDVEGGVE